MYALLLTAALVPGQMPCAGGAACSWPGQQYTGVSQPFCCAHFQRNARLQHLRPEQYLQPGWTMWRYTERRGVHYRRPYDFRNFMDYPWHARYPDISQAPYSVDIVPLPPHPAHATGGDSLYPDEVVDPRSSPRTGSGKPTTRNPPTGHREGFRAITR